ncbi:ribonuclease H-like domain-containing protein [Tanacetum coccineum]
MESQSETTQTVSSLKLPVLKTGNYDLRSMKMGQYLTHTDYALWEVIVNGDVPIEDVNLQLLRSLPFAWNNIALIMRNKSDLNTMSMDDFYNNLKVYEAEIKSQSSSSSNSQNVAFVYLENTSSTNEAVNTAHEVTTANSQGQASSSTYADDVMFSFFANQYNSPQLDNEGLEQIDTDDLKEMDLKWQVAMLTMRVKRFLKKTGRNLNFNGKETVGFHKTKVECYNCHRRGHFARECRAPKNQGNRNRDAPRRIVPVETPNFNGSNLLQQDLEQIHEDDLEAIDLKWQLSLLSMRAKRYFQRTGKKIFINANDTTGYDKSKVECFNCNKMGHFSRKCRAPRNKEGYFRNQDNTRKQGNNEDTSSKAMLVIDGVGLD